MPRKRTKAAKQAHALRVWLETLELPTRVINALRRDLEIVTGEREGEEGGGVLAGFDQARFTEELYEKRGGQVGKVSSVAASAIETLRAAIPAPVSGDASEAARSAQATDAAPESAEEAQGNEPAPEGAEAAQGVLPEVAAPPDDAELTANAVSEVAAEVAEPPADVAPESGTEPVDAPPTPKRRGRPPRAAATTAGAPEPTEAPAVPAKRRGRPPRVAVASDAAAEPPRMHRARVAAALTVAQPAAPPAEAPAPAAPAAPAAPPVADPSFDVLLRLWRELHPQGRRAAMHYMASLAAEG